MFGQAGADSRGGVHAASAASRESVTQRLQQLLSTNAAVAAGQQGQLCELDLSLEQLPGLHQLDELCPGLQVRVQAMLGANSLCCTTLLLAAFAHNEPQHAHVLPQVLAVNMNKLSGLCGITGCSQLQQLTAQVRPQHSVLESADSHPPRARSFVCAADPPPLLDLSPLQGNCLAQLPELRCHPQLTCLLLDNNRVTQLTAAEALEPHAQLRVLSLANNQLGSLACGTFGSTAGLSRWCLSTWLPGLCVLKVPHNQLCSLAGLQGCCNLRHLDASHNAITCLQVRTAQC